MTLLNEFKGIQTYHDGLVVSDYKNVFPLGSSVIDRLGEKIVSIDPNTDSSIHYTPRGYFVDSQNNIYIVVLNKIYRFKYDISKTNDLASIDDTGADYIDGKMSAHYITKYKPGTNDIQDAIELKNTSSVCTFCESSTKPSQVYMCDGSYVYWWNNEETNEQRGAFVADVLPSPTALPKNDETIANADKFCVYDSLDGVNSDETYGYINMKEHYINSICWFNNRLTGVEESTNTVWMTATDPGQFLRYYDYADTTYTLSDDDTDIETSYTTSIKSPYQIYTDGGSTSSYNNQLWTFYVSSTTGSDRLRQVVPFGGRLYFMNTNSIEVWAATTSEQAPITITTQNTIHFGGRFGTVLNNLLYIVANGQTGVTFIAAIDSSGGMKRISNPEIEQRLGDDINSLSVMRQRDEVFVVVGQAASDFPYSGNNYAVTKQGYWFRWSNEFHSEDNEHAIASLIGDLAISSKGNIIKFTDETRTLDNGLPIARKIRDWFCTFTGRKIIRAVEVIGDAGKRLGTTYMDVDSAPNNYLHNGVSNGSDSSGINDRRHDGIYCAVTFNRGNSFTPRRYRKMGPSNTNDFVLIWRNLGSGNSFALEFGTSANYKLQIYQISIDIQ